jgi:hypothetical protein
MDKFTRIWPRARVAILEIGPRHARLLPPTKVWNMALLEMSFAQTGHGCFAFKPIRDPMASGTAQRILGYGQCEAVIYCTGAPHRCCA